MSSNQKRSAAPAGLDSPTTRLPPALEWIAQPLARLSTSHFNLRAGLTSDLSISVALIAASVWYGRMHLPAAVLIVVCGLFAFTFIEYSAHRWLFHGNTGPFKTGHDHHHDDPLGYDAMPFFMPPLFMCILAALFSLALPVGYALLLAGVIAAGYAAYGQSHVAIHVHRFKSPLMRRWVGFHNIHHYHPDYNFGVTTGLWDYILGTRYKRHPRPAARHS
ncbi:MAG: sterol desaturase family protein [Rhodanobacteraceae bacterium]